MNRAQDYEEILITGSSYAPLTFHLQKDRLEKTMV
jgi:hypothetical protein